MQIRSNSAPANPDASMMATLYIPSSYRSARAGYAQNMGLSCTGQARRVALVRRDVSSMQRWRASATSVSVRVRSGAWNRSR